VYAIRRAEPNAALHRVQFGRVPPPLVDSVEPVTALAEVFGLFLASTGVKMSVLPSGNSAMPHSLQSGPEYGASKKHAHFAKYPA
jgi:hypothetical protein